MADSSFALSRAVGIWLTLVAVESIHGLMRRLLLEPQLGDLRARQVSVFTGAVLIALPNSTAQPRNVYGGLPNLRLLL